MLGSGVAIYELTKTEIRSLGETTFADQGIAERGDLQRLLREQIDVIAPDTLIISEEFCEWEDSRKRIDLLGIDRDARLVVFELKRTEDGGYMELQAVRYAAMVSNMTFSRAVEVYGRHLEKIECPDDARASMLQFLGWEHDESGYFGQDVRIVLASADFSKELTTSILWLRNCGVEIRCVRIKPYALDGRTLLDVQQVIPLPEAADYTIGVEKAQALRRTVTSDRIQSRDFSKYDVTIDGKLAEIQVSKRGLVLMVAKIALDRLPWNTVLTVLPSARWLILEGDLEEVQFKRRAGQLTAKQGGKYDLARYFCDEENLLHKEGKTYALSNQWTGTAAEDAVNKLLAMLPTGVFRYSKSE